MKIKWHSAPKDSNFEAALSFLKLIIGEEDANHIVELFKSGKVEQFAAKDILRAAQTEALAETVEHVKKNIEKIKKGEEINPVLLCRLKNHPLTVADGMHRVSAIWHLGEDLTVHAIVVGE